jgi:hypothetical protein
MTPHGHERDLALNYLLGYSPEEEREAIADRLFSDDQFADSLAEAERDLLDAYARGELSSKDRAAVNSRLLISERQLEKLHLAKALAARSTARPNARLNRKLLTWAKKYGASQKPQPSTTSQQLVSNAPAQPPPMVVALLSPGANRDGDIQQFLVPQRAGAVRLDLQLAGQKVSASYSVRLVRQRETVYQLAALPPRLDSGMQLLSVTVPTTVLSAGQYRLYVTPVDSSVEPTTYNFQVL